MELVDFTLKIKDLEINKGRDLIDISFNAPGIFSESFVEESLSYFDDIELNEESHLIICELSNILKLLSYSNKSYYKNLTIDRYFIKVVELDYIVLRNLEDLINNVEAFSDIIEFSQVVGVLEYAVLLTLNKKLELSQLSPLKDLIRDGQKIVDKMTSSKNIFQLYEEVSCEIKECDCKICKILNNRLIDPSLIKKGLTYGEITKLLDSVIFEITSLLSNDLSYILLDLPCRNKLDITFHILFRELNALLEEVMFNKEAAYPVNLYVIKFIASFWVASPEFTLNIRRSLNGSEKYEEKEIHKKDLYSNDIGLIEVIYFNKSEEDGKIIFEYFSPAITEKLERVFGFRDDEVQHQLSSELTTINFQQSFDERHGLMSYGLYQLKGKEMEECCGRLIYSKSNTKKSILPLSLDTNYLEIDRVECQLQGLARKNMMQSFIPYPPESITKKILRSKVPDGKDLFNSLKKWIKRNFRFGNDRSEELITVWIMGTYIFDVFQSYPYLFIYETGGANGKSLLELIKEHAFNGELITSTKNTDFSKQIHLKRHSVCVSIEDPQDSFDKDFKQILKNRPMLKAERTMSGASKLLSVYSPFVFSCALKYMNSLDIHPLHIKVRLEENKKNDVSYSPERSDWSLVLRLWGLNQAHSIYERYKKNVEVGKEKVFAPLLALAEELQVQGVRNLVRDISKAVATQEGIVEERVSESPELILANLLMNCENLWIVDKERLDFENVHLRSTTIKNKVNAISREPIGPTRIKGFMIDELNLKSIEYKKSKHNDFRDPGVGNSGSGTAWVVLRDELLEKLEAYLKKNIMG